MNSHQRIEKHITTQGTALPAFERASVLYISGGFAYVRAVYRTGVPFFDGGERDEAWDVRSGAPEYVRDVENSEEFDEFTRAAKSDRNVEELNGIHVGASVRVSDRWLMRLRVGGIGTDLLDRMGEGKVESICFSRAHGWNSAVVKFADGLTLSFATEDLEEV